MRIRVVTAPTMHQAMALLKQELGEDAVLLSSRRIGGGFEVTAGFEEPEPEPVEAPAPPPPPPPPPPGAASDPAVIRFHNLPPQLAQQLGAGPLETTLAARLAFAPLPDGIHRPLLLAGPPGAGKTLTIAKLAARIVLGGGPVPVIVAADGERAAAAEQLAVFARVLGAPLLDGTTPAAAAAVLAARLPGSPALIDTTGTDPFDPAQARRLAELVAATRAVTVLVLPAGLDPAEAADLARAFALLGATHLLPTRLDAARRMGCVLAAAATGLVLTEAGTGAQVAGGLSPMDPAWLAARLRQRAPRAAAEGHAA